MDGKSFLDARHHIVCGELVRHFEEGMIFLALRESGRSKTNLTEKLPLSIVKSIFLRTDDA